MKITKSQLKQLIKEELESVLSEADENKYMIFGPTIRDMSKFGMCIYTLKLVNIELGTPVEGTGGHKAKTCEEAKQKAEKALNAAVVKLGLDISKIKRKQ